MYRQSAGILPGGRGTDLPGNSLSTDFITESSLPPATCLPLYGEMARKLHIPVESRPLDGGPDFKNLPSCKYQLVF